MNRFEKILAIKTPLDGLSAVLCAITVAALAYMVSIAWAQPTNLGPTFTVTALTTAATNNAVPANPSRRSILLCNSSQTAANLISFTTGNLTPTATNGILIPATPAQGVLSCFSPPSGIIGGLGAQINAIMVAGTANLIAIEF